MNAEILLRELAANDIHLQVHEGKLRIDAPKGVLTDDIREAIKSAKSELLALLQDAPETRKRPGKVGRWGKPCPVCGDEWQWPTTNCTWICSWCYAGGVITEGILA